MSERLEPGLNACGCCEGLTLATPVEVTSRPGLSAVGYRVGTHGSFKAPVDGDLVLRCRDAWNELADNSGSLKVRLKTKGAGKPLPKPAPPAKKKVADDEARHADDTK